MLVVPAMIIPPGCPDMYIEAEATAPRVCAHVSNSFQKMLFRVTNA